jgi:hypothetical protein
MKNKKLYCATGHIYRNSAHPARKWPSPLGAFSPRVENRGPVSLSLAGGSLVDSGRPVASGVVAGGQAQARGVPIWGSGEEEAHRNSVVHGGERQPVRLVGDGVTRSYGGRRLGLWSRSGLERSLRWWRLDRTEIGAGCPRWLDDGEQGGGSGAEGVVARHEGRKEGFALALTRLNRGWRQRMAARKLRVGTVASWSGRWPLVWASSFGQGHWQAGPTGLIIFQIFQNQFKLIKSK